MPAGRGDFQRALGGFLPLDLRQIGTVIAFRHFAHRRGREEARTLEMVEQRQQPGRRHDLDIARPGGLRPLNLRTHQPAPGFRRMHRGEQHAG